MMSENPWKSISHLTGLSEISSETDITEVFTHLTRHFRIPWKNLSWLSLPNIRFHSSFGTNGFTRCPRQSRRDSWQIHGPAASHKRRVRSIWHRRQAWRRGKRSSVQLCTPITPHLRAIFWALYESSTGQSWMASGDLERTVLGHVSSKFDIFARDTTGHDTSDYEILHYSYVGSSLQRQNILKLLCTLLQLYSIIFRRGTAPSLLDRQGIPPSK